MLLPLSRHLTKFLVIYFKREEYSGKNHYIYLLLLITAIYSNTKRLDCSKYLNLNAFKLVCTLMDLWFISHPNISFKVSVMSTAIASPIEIE